MARNIEEIKDLARHAVRGTVPADFTASKEEVNETLREELSALAKDYNTYRRNKYDIFEIIQEAADEIIPNEVLSTMGQFAEVRQFPNNVKPQFKVKKGRARAKRFVTRAAQSGVYRAFRLDTDVVDVNTYAVGTAAYIDFERFLSGDEDMAEMASIITESIQDYIYEDIQKALRATINEVSRPTANKVTTSSFDADQFAKLCATVKAYGNGAVIFAPPEFVAEMGPLAVNSNITPNVSVNDIEDIRTKGYIGIFRGCPIVQLPQSFTDETNAMKVIDPQLIYIFPDAGEKPIKVVFEGQTLVKEFENRDWSTELQTYQKFGVAIMNTNHLAVFKNTSLSKVNTPGEWA